MRMRVGFPATYRPATGGVEQGFRCRGEAKSYLLTRCGDHAQPNMVYMLSGVELAEAKQISDDHAGRAIRRTTCAFRPAMYATVET